MSGIQPGEGLRRHLARVALLRAIARKTKPVPELPSPEQCKALRLAAAFSVDHVAEACGIDRDSLRRWENDTARSYAAPANEAYRSLIGWIASLGLDLLVDP